MLRTPRGRQRAEDQEFWESHGESLPGEIVSTNHRFSPYFGHDSSIRTPICIGTRAPNQHVGLACADQGHPRYHADFYPYGGERSYTNTCPQKNYKFEGKERDTETGNDDFGARYHSNRFGRWLSDDWSAVPMPVPYASLTNPGRKTPGSQITPC